MSRPLSRFTAHSMPALVLVLAAGSLAAGTPASPALRALKAQEPARAARAQTQLLALRGQAGLGAEDGFRARQPFTNAQGRTIVRFDQTYKGLRVWGGETIAHVEADGQIKVHTQGLKPGIALDGSPRLSAEQASTLALKNLAPKGALAMSPRVESVVFPSSFTGGFATKWDATRKAFVLDPERSVLAKAPTAPYLWAYEVQVHLQSAEDGIKDVTYILDATTGAMLRKTQIVRQRPGQASALPRAQRANLVADIPTTGTGHGEYSGTVTLNMSQSSVDGTYSLLDSTRGTLPNPMFNNWLGDTQPGLRACYDHMDPITLDGFIIPGTYSGHATNTWGDGLPFNGVGVPWITDPVTGEQYFQGAKDPNGETAAVDAMVGMSASWDFYQNLFGRNGMDGQGTSVIADVHIVQPSFGSDINDATGGLTTNPYGSTLLIGDGTSSDPLDPNGTLPCTEVDLVAQQMTDIVFETSGLVGSGWWGESTALMFGSMDIFGKMVQAYASRPAGQDASVPEFSVPSDPTSWQLGVKSGKGVPRSWMYKPSLDGVSSDGWYDGIEVTHQQAAGGPLRRMFYFLSQGSSSSSSSDTYSPFLPAGMTGIGNDAATKIWYKAVTEHLLLGSNYADARDAALASAQELFGAGSAEETAVMKAFAAVNVGDAPGQPKRVKVSFPIVHPGGEPFTNPYSTWYPDKYSKIQIFPTAARVQVKCDVENTTNTALTWSLGDPLKDTLGDGGIGEAVAGVINADGTWTTPSYPLNSGYLLVLKATSQADSKQFAKGRMFVVPIDADLNNDADAFDLGLVAMAYGLGYSNNPFPTAAVTSQGGPATDLDVAAFVEAFTNAFPAK